MGILYRGADVGMAHKMLDDRKGYFCFEQVCGKGMAEDMSGNGLLYTCPYSRIVDQLLRTALQNWLRTLAVLEEPVFGPERTVVLPEENKGPLRQHRIPVTPAFAAIDAQHHPVAVHIGNLEGCALSQADARGIQDRNDRPCPYVSTGSDKSLYLFLAEYFRHLEWFFHAAESIHDVAVWQKAAVC